MNIDSIFLLSMSSDSKNWELAKQLIKGNNLEGLFFEHIKSRINSLRAYFFEAELWIDNDMKIVLSLVVELPFGLNLYLDTFITNQLSWRQYSAKSKSFEIESASCFLWDSNQIESIFQSFLKKTIKKVLR